MFYSILAFAATALAQSQYLLPSNPGGAVPAGVQPPSISGFKDATVQPSKGGLAVCVSGTVTVKASTKKALKFDYSIPRNESQVAETWLEFITKGSPFTDEIMAGMTTLGGTYDIMATLCTPANNTKPSGVQILTHGVGFDRYYWDFLPGYSYVDVAAIFGYATFFYDRLSVGESEKPHALDVQTSLELEILHGLVEKLRDGQLAETKFSTVIGAGHSYGSILTQALTSAYPSDLDAAILTGFGTYMDGMPPFIMALNLDIASQNQPYRFPGLGNGYLVSSSAISLQLGFFRAPSFDPNVLYMAESTKGSVTIGELFSTTAITKPAMDFKGPVAIVNGENDLPFCLGNCSTPATSPHKAFASLYSPNITTGSYLAPKTGHGLNFHYTAVEAFYWIQKFIKQQGL